MSWEKLDKDEVFRFLKKEHHLIGNVYTMVKLEKSFPDIFHKMKLDNHSSVLLFQPERYPPNNPYVSRLYECLQLHVPNRHILFSQEGMTICTLNSITEDPCMNMADPLLSKEIFKVLGGIRRSREGKKEDFSMTLGHTKINVENVSDLEWYFNRVNTDFEYIMFCAFENIEEEVIKERNI